MYRELRLKFFFFLGIQGVPERKLSGNCCSKGGPTAAEIAAGWQPVPLVNSDWDRIEADLAAARVQEAEQATDLKG